MSDTTIAKCECCGQEMRGTDYIERLRAMADAVPDLLSAAEAALAGYDSIAKESNERNDDRFVAYVFLGDALRAAIKKAKRHT